MRYFLIAATMLVGLVGPVQAGQYCIDVSNNLQLTCLPGALVKLDASVGPATFCRTRGFFAFLDAHAQEDAQQNACRNSADQAASYCAKRKHARIASRCAATTQHDQTYVVISSDPTAALLQVSPTGNRSISYWVNATALDHAD